MKYELENFSKSNIRKIQKNFLKKATVNNGGNKEDFLEKERAVCKRNNILLSYKKRLEKREITTKDIPEEFIDELTEIYLKELKRKQK